MSTVTPTGFVPKTLEQITAEEVAELEGSIDANLNVQEENPLGQLLATVNDRIADLWDGISMLYGAINPKKAEGFLLDEIGVLRGVPRVGATASTIVLSVEMAIGATVTEGMLFGVVSNPAIQFAAEEFTAPAYGFWDVTATCTKKGKVEVFAGTAFEIITPAVGVLSVLAPNDANTGTEQENDPSYRDRLEAAQAQQGSTTLAALQSALIGDGGPQGIVSALVLENTGDATDANGLPPHSFEVVVWDGAVPAASNNAIAQTIYENTPLGITSQGSSTGTATDAYGKPFTERFTRATQKPVYVDMTVKYTGTSGTVAADVKTRLATYMNAKAKLGVDVTYLEARSCVLETLGGVAGVSDVPVFYMDFVSSPSGTSNLTLAPREIYAFDTANITVTVT